MKNVKHKENASNNLQIPIRIQLHAVKAQQEEKSQIISIKKSPLRDLSDETLRPQLPISKQCAPSKAAVALGDHLKHTLMLSIKESDRNKPSLVR